jgi:sec-independent protein translocase protein TatA
MVGLFGMAGATEWVVILVIVLIFFGVGKLPQVLGQMGKGVKAFKDGMKEPEAQAPEIEARVVDPPSASRVPEAEEVRRG